MHDTKKAAPLLAKLRPSEQTQLFLENYQQGNMDVVVIDRAGGTIFSKKYTPDLPKKYPKGNLYYTLNAVDETFVGTKPGKTDIAQLRGWGADIDPITGKERDPDELLFKRYHISSALKHKNPKTVRELAYILQEVVHPIMEGNRGLPPSLLIFSGRGIQLIWYADKDYRANEKRISTWEDLGRAIIATVGGDAVQNVDRLLRLPGTANTKTGLLARIMWENDVTYSPKQIHSAYGDAPTGTVDNRQGVDPSEFKYVDWEAVFATTELFDMEDSIVKRFQRDLNRNTDLASLYDGNVLPGMRDTSGSSFDLNLIGLLKRLTYEPQDAFQIAMTYDAGSGHKHAEVKNKRHFMRCWARTTESSPEEDFADIPAEKVDKTEELTHHSEGEAEKDIRNNYMYIAHSEKIIHLKSSKFCSVRGFDLKFGTTHTGGKDAPARATQTLIAAGRQADEITWMPGKEKVFRENGLNHLNMYRPHPCAPVNYTKGCTSIFHKVLHHVITVKASAEYFLDWCAFTVQFPHIKINHHPLMFSREQGVGKDTIIDPIRFAVGSWNAAEVDITDITASFNEALKFKKLVIINEVESFKEGKAAANALKPLLAAPPETILINAKFLNKIEHPNLFALIMTSNSPRPIHIAGFDRRHVVIHCREEKMSPAMAKEVWHWLKEEGGRELMHYELMHRDVSNFDPNVRPDCEDLMEDHRNMQEDSRSGTEMIISDYIGARQGLFARDIVLAKDLEDFREEKRLGSRAGINEAIMDVGGVLIRNGSFRDNNHHVKKANFWVIRNHEKYVWTDKSGRAKKKANMSYREMYDTATGLTDFDGV